MNNATLICGIGNPMLKDDRAGIEVAERIERSGLPVDVEIIYGVGFEVLDKVMGYDEVIIIDACKIGHPPGTIIEASVNDIFSDHLLASSHAVTLGSTLKVGYNLFPQEMPGTLTILLIEAEDYFEFTRDCSPAVVQAIDKVEVMLSRQIRAAAKKKRLMV